MNKEETGTAFQPDPEYIIGALKDELSAANDNRVYLISVLKQAQAEFAEAQDVWAAERESLLKRIQELLPAPGGNE